MSKIDYRIDVTNESFYIMENPKTTGNVERRFPREYQCVPLSNDGFKIISLENQLQIYAGKIEDHTIDGVEFTDVFEFCKELANVIYAGAGAVAEPLGADCETAVHTKDCDREELLDKLDEQLAELVKIYGAVDGLELTTENIRIEAGQINLSTDEVEALLAQIKGLIILKGSDCANALFVKDCGTQDLLDKLQEVIDALNTNSQAEQALLTSIDTKLDELENIKTELVTANTTLTNIKTDTAQINTNLETVIEKLDDQITALEDLKVLVTETNTKLTTANATLNTISEDIATIKTDIGLIKTDISDIKTGVNSIDNKLNTVITSLTSIESKLDAVVTELQTINTTLQTEFDQTQVKLDDIKTAIQDKGKDCDNKVFTNICNVQELADAINAGSRDYTAVLNSIDGKASNLATIVTELQTANTTLTSIEADTTATNTKLDTLIQKATDQITELQGIKSEITAGNLKLDQIVTKLTNIDSNINTIKSDVSLIKADISEIKDDVKLAVEALDNITLLILESNDLLINLVDELDIELIVNSYEKNNGTINYIQRDTILWDSETSTQVSLTAEFTTDGINWTTTPPAGDVNLGFLCCETLVLGQEFLNCGTKTDGTKSEWYIRQDYLGTEELPLKYSQDKITWTETAPTDTTFILGACPVEVPTPICIENVTYDLNGAKGIIFESQKLNSYDAQVYKGEMKYTEKNNVIFVEETYNHSNGFTQDDRLLPNELKIVNKNANSRTIIKVLQVCGYIPIIADVIDETMVLLVSAEPKADNTAIDVTFTDVPPDGSTGATGYRIKRYVKGANISTATTLLDWTEGVANALITNNNNGTYTYKDATAVLGTDYMYFYEAYNIVSEGKSNELEASLFATSFEPLMRTTTANETVTLPMTVTSPVTIEWGDGTTTTQSAPFTKVYATAGDYHIKVKITASREVTNFRFANTGDRLKLINIKNWGWVKLGTTGGNFWGCSNLEKITAEDTPSGLNNLSYFFLSCSKLAQIDNFNWDTSQVTNMQGTFNGCTLFNLPVSQLNTSNVFAFNETFVNCSSFNQSVNWNTSKAVNMNVMFRNASSFNQAINFQIPLVTNLTNFVQNTALSPTNMDNCLINFANQTTQNNVNMANNRPRTSASNSAVATLQGRGWIGLI